MAKIDKAEIYSVLRNHTVVSADNTPSLTGMWSRPFKTSLSRLKGRTAAQAAPPSQVRPPGREPPFAAEGHDSLWRQSESSGILSIGQCHHTRDRVGKRAIPCRRGNERKAPCNDYGIDHHVLTVCGGAQALLGHVQAPHTHGSTI